MNAHRGAGSINIGRVGMYSMYVCMCVRMYACMVCDLPIVRSTICCHSFSPLFEHFICTYKYIKCSYNITYIQKCRNMHINTHQPYILYIIYIAYRKKRAAMLTWSHHWLRTRVFILLRP